MMESAHNNFNTNHNIISQLTVLFTYSFLYDGKCSHLHIGTSIILYTSMHCLFCHGYTIKIVGEYNYLQSSLLAHFAFELKPTVLKLYRPQKPYRRDGKKNEINLDIVMKLAMS